MEDRLGDVVELLKPYRIETRGRESTRAVSKLIGFLRFSGEEKPNRTIPPTDAVRSKYYASLGGRVRYYRALLSMGEHINDRQIAERRGVRVRDTRQGYLALQYEPKSGYPLVDLQPYAMQALHTCLLIAEQMLTEEQLIAFTSTQHSHTDTKLTMAIKLLRFDSELLSVVKTLTTATFQDIGDSVRHFSILCWTRGVKEYERRAESTTTPLGDVMDRLAFSAAVPVALPHTTDTINKSKDLP
eukprot:GHVQ01018626.1.p1 GENE.GHVQ01018626.1~~GHVQ01018626.1.p1  ORF type:complete len:243 (+),score=29.66 GHVQ01018626.1:316-1044(+)